MNGRTLAGLILIVVALIAFLHIGDRRGWDDPGPSPVFLLSLDHQSVDSLVIRGTSEIVHLQLWEDRWHVVSPIRDMADGEVIDRSLTALTGLSIHREFSADGELAPYGLDPPVLEILVFQPGAEPIRLKVGVATPSGEYRYVMTGDSTMVRLVSSSNLAPIVGDLFSLRNKRLLLTNDQEIVSIEWKRDQETVEVLREGDAWRMVEPVHARADELKIRELFRMLRDSVIESFLSTDEMNISREEWTRFVFNGFAPLTPETLWIYAEDPPNVYAKNSLRDHLFKADQRILPAIPRFSEDWRDRSLLPFPSYDVDYLGIEKPGLGSLTCRRNDTEWSVNGHRGDAKAITDLIRSMETCRVQEFQDDSGKPWNSELVLSMRSIFGDSAVMEFGMQEDGRQAVRAPHLGGFGTVTCLDTDSISVAIEAWRDHRLLNLLAYDVEEITVRGMGTAVSAERVDYAEWKKSDSWPGSPTVDDVLDRLVSIRIERFPEENEDIDLPDPSADIAIACRDIPLIRLRLYRAADQWYCSVDDGAAFPVESNMPGIIMRLLGG